MKPRPTIQDDDGGGLDSLLDTMTNVVGILIMVLIATQLGVKDAVTRISETGPVDPAAAAALQEKLRLTREQRDAIAARLADLDPGDEQAVRVQLAELRRQMEETRSRISEEQQVANRFSVKIEQQRQEADEARRKIAAAADAEEMRRRLREELARRLDDEAKLKARLDKTPAPRAPPPKVVTMPDPRPAPEGLRQVAFLCTHNRVYPVADDDARQIMLQRAEDTVRSKRLDGGPEAGVNLEKFQREFKRLHRTFRDDFFDVEIYAAGIYPRLKFAPRERDGATVDEVLRARSRFQRMIKSLDVDKYYALFIVLPDSYEAYMAARTVVSDHGLLAGWDPQPQEWEYTTHLGGAILFGPKPPPAPRPPPAAPAQPVKPANVID